jgi:FKBP-type peptidyl-prolyl cis-trans isomerase FkpA
VRKAGTGTTVINNASTVTVTYRGRLMNNRVFDPVNYTETNNASSSQFALYDANSAIPGFREAIIRAGVEGTDVTILIPSRLAYGTTGYDVIPANSCLHFDMSIGAVTN